MNDDLQDRLRRTYRAVGDNTTVDDVGPTGPFRRVASPARRWLGPALAAAAAVALLVGGLAVIDRRGSEPPADSIGTHVLPTWLPTPTALPTADAGGRPPLVSITSEPGTDVLEFESEAVTVTIRMDRTALAEFDGPTVVVRGGDVATTEIVSDGGRLRWNPSSTSTVTIEWTGPVFGDVESIVEVVNGLVLVDDEVWDEATEFGGFTREQELLRREIGPTELYLHGDLQSGLTFAIDAGFSVRAFDTGCSVHRHDDGTTWVVVGAAPSSNATMTWPDGFVATTDLSPFVAGSSIGAGIVENPSSEPEDRPDVVCEEEK